jgi:hypothetical protein
LRREVEHGTGIADAPAHYRSPSNVRENELEGAAVLRAQPFQIALYTRARQVVEDADAMPQ